MEPENKLYQQFQKIEFWAATALFLFFTLGLLSQAIHSENWADNKDLFDRNGLIFNWYSHYMYPSLIKGILYYGAFLLLIFQVAPIPVNRSEVVSRLLKVLLVFSALAVLTGICNTWTNGYMLANHAPPDFYGIIFRETALYSLWLFLMFVIYVMLKQFATYLLLNTEKLQKEYELVNKEGVFALIVYMYILFLMVISSTAKAPTTLFGIIVPFGIGLYWISIFRLIPNSLQTRKPLMRYLRDVFLILIVTIFPLVAILMLISNDGDFVIAVLFINFLFQLVITASVSWYIYKSRYAKDAEVNVLKTQLGRSAANLDFLKSQINPHFLFNALNTLYGTALQENAERTGEGIQRLGDMMRFMLEENLQDKISLNREIEYIRNYVRLQELRTGTSSNVSIKTEIDEPVNALSISPMLLIPFIENAFKHGVSMREPSHIKISLKLNGKSLFFDVYNSIHKLKENDPERNHKGIGMSNVRSRLEHHYPRKHELIIRENIDEYFVHLTIQL
jgi:two-component system, LytTR family, sensor kinase